MPAGGRQWMQILPMPQVGRAIQQGRSTDVADTGAHQLVPGIVLAPYGVVAVLDQVQSGRRLGNDGIVRVLVPRQQTVRTRCDARALFTTDGATVDDGRRAMVVDRDSGPAAARIWSAGGWRQSHREISPVNQVLAGGMAPVHV